MKRLSPYGPNALPSFLASGHMNADNYVFFALGEDNSLHAERGNQRTDMERLDID